MSGMPKTLYLYWGRNKPLSFMRWMTVCSFAELNPEWQIHVFSPEVPYLEMPWKSGEQHSTRVSEVDWFPRLALVPNVACSIFNFATLNLPADLPEVIRSDILRWYLLWTEGGAWSDFDILWVDAIDKIIDGQRDVYLCQDRTASTQRRIRRRVIVRQGKAYQAIGFMAGKRGHNLWRCVFKKAEVQCNRSVYQSAGRFALEAAIYESKYQPRCFDPCLVYPFSAQQIGKIYETGSVPRGEFVGIHWFAGDAISARFEPDTTPDSLAAREGFVFKHMRHIWENAREVRCRLQNTAS